MLDPLFTLSSQNQRLTENTQRSSDQLRSQHLKESKEKGKRTGSIDSTELSGDLNEMGEDLLGSMDPDLMGGGGSAELFKKLWEETVEKEPEEEEDEGEGAPPEPEDRHTEEPEEAPEDPAAPAPTPDRIEVEAPVEAREAARNQERAPEPPGRAEAPRREDPSAPSPDTRVSRADSRKGRGPDETTVSPVEKADPEPPPAAPAVGGGSLLDLSEGFLLHESRVEVQEDDSGAEAPELAPISPDLEAILGRLMEGDSRSPAWPRLQRLLGRFGLGVLAHCAGVRTKVYLLPRGSRLGSHPKVRNEVGAGSPVGAAYLPESRTCLVEEESLLEAPRGFHPALYYFAQAYDHALGGEDFASLQSAAVKASFEACRRGLPGHSLPDGMAAESPIHYFAQAVEAYLSEADCVEPLWTREDLYDFDRSMFSYVEYLLKQGNRGR